MISLHYESRFGLARGAVSIDGRPHLYLEGYERDESLGVFGTRSVARLTGRGGGVAFLTLADGAAAILDAPQAIAARLTDGAAVEIVITAEARRGKTAVAKWLAPASGEVRRLSPVVTMKERLIDQARRLIGDEIGVAEDEDDGDLDAVRDAAIDPSGPLPEAGFLSVERTRALIACDVDAAGATGRDFVRLCNERAVSEVARRLRLSGLAGLVVVDLIGRRHDVERLRALLTQASHPESLIIGPVSKFGTLEFVRPWGACPAMDLPAPLRDAGQALRDAVRVAAGQPGRILTLRAPQATLDIVRPLLKGSLDPLSALIRLEPGPVPEIITS